jgi:hypothetical protein
MIVAVSLFLLCSTVAAEPLDRRADAIDRILPGQALRVHSLERTTEGRFVTNRADTLLLQGASERLALSYSDIQRIDLRRTARHHGMVIGMIVGGISLAAAAASGHDVGPVIAGASGVFIGGFVGGVIGGAISEWHRVYDAHAPADSASRHH